MSFKFEPKTRDSTSAYQSDNVVVASVVVLTSSGTVAVEVAVEDVASFEASVVSSPTDATTDSVVLAVLCVGDWGAIGTLGDVLAMRV